jgi:hypothetical protein
MLEATFVRRRGSSDRVYVVRSDTTTTAWDFPSYGDGLPHDLRHLVVEDALGLASGFWGLVDHGVEVALVDDETTLVRHGTPLVDLPGFDFSGLTEAEEAVALLASPFVQVDDSGPLAVARVGTPSTGTRPGDVGDVGDVGARLGFTLPASATTVVIAAITDRLRELGRQWAALEDGGAITVTFGPDRPPR